MSAPGGFPPAFKGAPRGIQRKCRSYSLPLLGPPEVPGLKGREGSGSNMGHHPLLPLSKSQTWWGKGRFLSGDILQDVNLRSAEWRKERNRCGPCYQWK